MEAGGLPRIGTGALSQVARDLYNGRIPGCGAAWTPRMRARSGWVVDVSFGTVWEAFARELPDAIAISEPGRDYSYAEFEERSARLAAALADAGVGPGDKVACYLYNGAAYLETVFAAFKLGAVPVNVNYRYTSEELFALLADADAAAMVFSAELAGNVTDVAARLPSLRLLVKVGAGAAVPDVAGLMPLSSESCSPRTRRARPGRGRGPMSSSCTPAARRASRRE